jgi:hypothetical protein
MSNVNENMVINLLGLEIDLWEKTDDNERKSYGRAMLHFTAFFLLACISSVYLIYLISGSYLVSTFAGLLLALIIGSVVRFSLIILRRSIFDEPKAAAPQQKSPDPVAEEKPVSKEDSFILKTITRILQPFKKIQFKWRPGSNKAVPGLAALIRLVIITVMGLIVLFPLSCLLHQSTIEELNEIKRQYYVDQFEADGRQTLLVKTNLLQKEITAIEAELKKNKDIYQEGGLLTEKRSAIARLKVLMNVEIANHNLEYSSQLERYKTDIKEKYFLSLSFTAVTGLPFFYFALVLIGFLLFMPHLILFRLKSKPGLTYSTLSTDRYRTIIDQQYAKTNREGYSLLKEKFGYDPQGYDKHVYWANPPYCTVPNKPFADRKAISQEVFLKSFETDIIN